MPRMVSCARFGSPDTRWTVRLTQRGLIRGPRRRYRRRRSVGLTRQTSQTA